MTKPKNVTRIISEDYPKEMAPTIDQLGGTLNEYMQDTFDILDGRVDFDNLIFKKIQFDIQVNTSGKPLQPLQLKTGVNQPSGFQVIRAVNISNPLISATAQPFVAQYSSKGQDIVSITKVTGLTSGDKYRLTVLVF
jgi:hypothetical protein